MPINVAAIATYAIWSRQSACSEALSYVNTSQLRNPKLPVEHFGDPERFPRNGLVSDIGVFNAEAQRTQRSAEGFKRAPGWTGVARDFQVIFIILITIIAGRDCE